MEGFHRPVFRIRFHFPEGFYTEECSNYLVQLPRSVLTAVHFTILWGIFFSCPRFDCATDKRSSAILLLQSGEIAADLRFWWSLFPRCDKTSHPLRTLPPSSTHTFSPCSFTCGSIFYFYVDKSERQTSLLGDRDTVNCYSIPQLQPPLPFLPIIYFPPPLGHCSADLPLLAPWCISHRNIPHPYHVSRVSRSYRCLSLTD